MWIITLDASTKGGSGKNDCSGKYISRAYQALTVVTVILLLVSATLAQRDGGVGDRIEIVDPSDPTKLIYVEEKYPGESQW